MSSIYSLEPRTRGHVILSTTHGPVELFLWSDECPNAVRNFLQHALNGYYDGLAFHRVIPGVLAQTGDPSRTGSGGIPAIGDRGGFLREQHGRLKFRRRGIAAMVADEEGKVRSQFFLTLAATPWLDGQHTIFGQVQGDSVFNLLNLAATEVDGFDGDSVPRLKTIDVVDNPFPDIIAAPKPQLVKESPQRTKVTAPTAKRAVKSSKLLSFQDDIDSESDDESASRVLPKPRKRRRPLESVRATEVLPFHEKKHSPSLRTGEVERHESAKNDMLRKPPSAKPDNATVKREAEEEFERLKAEYLNKIGVAGSIPNDEEAKQTPSENQEPPEHEVINVTGRKRPRKPDEGETLRRLKAFQTRMEKSRRLASTSTSPATTNGMAAWFSRGLRLGTAAMEQEEYEVRFGPPARASSRNKKR